MKIFTKGITAFTDELTNKKQIEIKKSDLKSGIYDAGNISFSDFVYNPENDEAVSLIVKGKGFMDSLIVSSKNLMIQKIQAAEMNVRLKGQVITVKDSIEAVNVMIEAGDDDTACQHRQSASGNYLRQNLPSEMKWMLLLWIL